jgi:hypothetical protein
VRGKTLSVRRWFEQVINSQYTVPTRKRGCARSSSDLASLRFRPELDVGDISGNHSFDLAKRGTQTCLSQPDARFQARINLSPCEQLPSRRVSRGGPSTAETLERGMRIGLARHQPGPQDEAPATPPNVGGLKRKRIFCTKPSNTRQNRLRPLVLVRRQGARRPPAHDGSS